MYRMFTCTQKHSRWREILVEKGQKPRHVEQNKLAKTKDLQAIREKKNWEVEIRQTLCVVVV